MLRPARCRTRAAPAAFRGPLRDLLPAGWRASLLAVYGATTSGVAAQVARLPRDATHLVVSVGGNDALGYAHLLGAPVRSIAEAMSVLAEAQDAFARSYSDMLGAVLAARLPTALCTIYDTPRSAPDHRIVKAALALFNDAISRAAFSSSLPLVDLRLICDADEDYANPIEPSVQGGAKMARAIARLACGDEDDWRRPLAVVG